MPAAPEPPVLDVAITGAAGRIGTALRRGLDPGRFRLRLVDLRPVAAPAPGHEVRTADLRDPDAALEALTGVDAVVHLAARPDEAGFAEIHERNVVPAYNVYEAARRAGVRRVVFASSIHVTGFAPWGAATGPLDPPRPDTFYGLSKLYGEALGRLYADRHGIEVVNLRLGGFGDEPLAPPYLWFWLSPGDAVRLATAALTAPGITFTTCYGVSRNRRGFHSREGWDELGYDPEDDAERFAGRWPGATPPPLQGAEFTDPGYAFLEPPSPG
jgi:uronate dehydrogenase